MSYYQTGDCFLEECDQLFAHPFVLNIKKDQKIICDGLLRVNDFSSLRSTDENCFLKTCFVGGNRWFVITINGLFEAMI